MHLDPILNQEVEELHKTSTMSPSNASSRTAYLGNATGGTQQSHWRDSWDCRGRTCSILPELEKSAAWDEDLGRFAFNQCNSPSFSPLTVLCMVLV